MENVKILIDGIQKEVAGLFYTFDSKYYFIYTEKEIDENGYVILYMTQVGRETKNTENGPVDTGYMVGLEITDPEEQKKVQTSISYIVEDKKNNTVNPAIQYLPMSMLANFKILSKKRFKLIKSIMIENFKLQFEESVVSTLENTENLLVSNTNSNDLIADGFNEENLNPTPIPLNDLLSSHGELEPPSNVQEINSLAEQSPVESKPLSQVSNIEIAGETEKVTLQETNDLIQKQNLEKKVESGPVVENVIIDYRAKYFELEEKNSELQNQIDELTKKIEDIKKVLE